MLWPTRQGLEFIQYPITVRNGETRTTNDYFGFRHQALGCIVEKQHPFLNRMPGTWALGKWGNPNSRALG